MYRHTCNWTSFKLDIAYIWSFLFFICRYIKCMLLEECWLQTLFSCTYTKCKKINLLCSSHTYKKFCLVHMQRYAAFATLQHAILFTQKNENQNSPNIHYLPLHASSMPDREYVLEKYNKFKHLRTMQTKIAFMKKFRINLTREIHASIWSYVLSSCLLSVLGTRGYVNVLFECLLCHT